MGTLLHAIYSKYTFIFFIFFPCLFLKKIFLCSDKIGPNVQTVIFRLSLDSVIWKLNNLIPIVKFANQACQEWNIFLF